MINTTMKCCATGLVLFALLTLCAAAPTDKPEVLRIRIIHTNDMHARFEQTSRRSGICNSQDAASDQCYGGFARIAHLVRTIRNSSTSDLPVFFLNAGDTYQGTKLFTAYKWKIVAKFLNILKPDAASLGNHEFDDGVKGLVPFLNNVTFPVVTANLDLSDEPSLTHTKNLKNYTIFEVKNRKIGVIGYLTPETTTISQTGDVKILDEVPVVQKFADELKAQGVDIIIALGHSGYEVDKKIAREVDGVDLVIGGHTNTFLFDGKVPDLEQSEGFYPTEVVQKSGRKAYVVQAYAYTKYLGNLFVDFDREGEISRIRGNPILVDHTIPQDQDVLEELKVWVEPLANVTKRVVGKTKVLLQGGEKTCRLWECNFGNMLTDAMIRYNAMNYQGDGWTDAPIAIHQSGGIRASIEKTNKGKVIMEDLITAFPFGTKVVKVDVSAEILRQAVEHSVHDRLSMNETAHGGAFLQMSGLKVTYDLEKPKGSRAVDIQVRCGNCSVPVYEPIDPDATYKILIPNFMYLGGDGFKMFKNTKMYDSDMVIADLVADYITQESPVYPGVEGRIRFGNASSSVHTTNGIYAFLVSCLVAIKSWFK
ncbi:unnamed protein product [Trichogramma brassicae]|uniref:5'-nucleotidase n=1 Tax=Trichogramma brassicae TaxID=86971 RepID=A0A6H5IRT2_9HYME|nr:unnamed protein product [Trichogramma brassicae]